MMTSRAEYRLLLRQDNADLRLRKKGYQAGLISEEDYQKILTKEEQIKTEISRVEHTNIGANKEVQTLLESYNSTPLKSGTTLAELIRRPELSYEAIKPLDKERPELPWDVQEQVDINIKYDGYIRRQLKQVEQFKKLEAKKIPTDLDYEKVGSLRIEARQKLEAYRPISIGQASRISGVSPADISVLLRRDNSGAVVFGHFLISFIDLLVFKATIVDNCCFTVIRYENSGNTTKIFVHMNMGINP